LVWLLGPDSSFTYALQFSSDRKVHNEQNGDHVAELNLLLDV